MIPVFVATEIVANKNKQWTFIIYLHCCLCFSLYVNVLLHYRKCKYRDSAEKMEHPLIHDECYVKTNGKYFTFVFDLLYLIFPVVPGFICIQVAT